MWESWKIRRYLFGLFFGVVVLIVLLSAGHFLFRFAAVEGAGSEPIVFTDDVILDLDGLAVTVYIAAGSKAMSLEVGATTLAVYGVPYGVGDFFRLKTAVHTILEVSSTQSSIGFSISSADINSAGYISKWVVDATGEVNFVVGVSDTNTYYAVRLNGIEIAASPVKSSAEAPAVLVFANTGIGTYTIIGGKEFCQLTNVRGWAWSDNIGWVSFSCMNEYLVGEGINYGVNIDKTTRELSGYAWSDNVGWISFNKGDLTGCPAAPDPCEAKLVSNKLVGWAKVLSNNEWVSFYGKINGDFYEVTLIRSDFYGWAWGDTTIGWLSFNCANNEGECLVSNYKVWTTLQPETVLPTIRTDPASRVRFYPGEVPPKVTAVLNATLLSLGGDIEAKVWLEWGADPYNFAYTSRDPQNPDVKTGITSFSKPITITNVSSGEKYYFRAFAENIEGVAEGNLRSFLVAGVEVLEGDIIIIFGEFRKQIAITEDGRIEVIE